MAREQIWYVSCTIVFLVLAIKMANYMSAIDTIACAYFACMTVKVLREKNL